MLLEYVLLLALLVVIVIGWLAFGKHNGYGSCTAMGTGIDPATGHMVMVTVVVPCTPTPMEVK